MTGWLIETLVWTGLLIGLVLLLRRPVNRLLGPKAAYGLWLLPFLRLFMPPLVLPAWLAPAKPVPNVAEISGYTIEPAIIAPGELVAVAPPVAWAPILIGLWLGGAVIFLIVRFSDYFQMRRNLLAQGRPVGEVGSVRLLETPAATAPLAFGVLDKVIALPPGFMALHDRQQRDFALAHELAHHLGHDLLVNMAAQSLFALHWFNPLAWIGWRAMRRDQEAACDARVTANSSAQDKASYAQVIASFAAAGPNAGLAAPMACPVLGDKSIIHRLRSLTMSDVSSRRRFAGRAMMGAAVLALPLTASISYAESLVEPQAPVAEVSAVPPSPPAPPAPPAAIVGAGDMPASPVPPAPPVRSISSVPPPAPPPRVFMVRGGDAHEDGAGDHEKIIIRKSMEEDGKGKKVEIRKHVFIADEEAMSEEAMSEEEREMMRKEIRESMGDMKIALVEMKHDLIELQADADAGTTRVKMACKGDKKTKEFKSDDGVKVIEICTDDAMAKALIGLKAARKELAKNSDMSDEMRAEVLKSLDEAIADWGDSTG